jgi:hypothetical protein
MQLHVGWEEGSSGGKREGEDVRLAGLEAEAVVQIQGGDAVVAAREFERGEVERPRLLDESLEEGSAVLLASVALRDDDVVDIATLTAQEPHRDQGRHGDDPVRLGVTTDHDVVVHERLPDVVPGDGRGGRGEFAVERGDVCRVIQVQAGGLREEREDQGGSGGHRICPPWTE